ncbi:crossover junction endodeoxyribonuclease RuvC [Streptomyces sp. Midd1]|uniref:crossover junction endodeoxyribonuclease RuvC n=1 Tax=Streptomyces sp. Midd3 TaxID=3161191 RepID=UPI0034DB2E1D
MPRYAIGIDQSYSGCAVVCYSPTDGTASETVFDFSPKQVGTGIRRLVTVHAMLREHFATIERLGQITHICYEGYSYGSKFRREELGELGCALKLALATQFPMHLERRVHAVAPSTVKKFVTGSGRADKDKIMLAVYMRWHHEPSSNDAADAYALARIADALATPEPPELKFQQEVLDTIRNPPKKTRAKNAT